MVVDSVAAAAADLAVGETSPRENVNDHLTGYWGRGTLLAQNASFFSPFLSGLVGRQGPLKKTSLRPPFTFTARLGVIFFPLFFSALRTHDGPMIDTQRARNRFVPNAVVPRNGSITKMCPRCKRECLANC